MQNLLKLEKQQTNKYAQKMEQLQIEYTFTCKKSYHSSNFKWDVIF